MDLILKGKVVIVTGASQGIGRAIAITFAQEGANVVISDLNEEKGASVVDEIKVAGGEALMVKTDVSKMEDAERLAKAALDTFSGIDILVNDAAAPRTFGDFWKIGRDVWQQNIDVNLYGAMNTCRAVIEHMIAQQSGRIINVASDSGRVGEPRCPWYCASKAGVVGFTKGLAIDVGRYGITVNAVYPGFTMVERYKEMNEKLLAELGPEKFEERQRKLLKLYPMRKLGKPQDVADMVVFLCSDRAGHITGQAIAVDGGYCMAG